MFDLQFETGNDAFANAPEMEVYYILRNVAKKVESGERDGVVKDSNGNQIGTWYLS